MSIKPMPQSAVAVEILKQTLLERAMKDSTPKKYSVPMYEAWEVIGQLQRELDDAKAAVKGGEGDGEK